MKICMLPLTNCKASQKARMVPKEELLSCRARRSARQWRGVPAGRCWEGGGRPMRFHRPCNSCDYSEESRNVVESHQKRVLTLELHRLRRTRGFLHPKDLVAAPTAHHGRRYEAGRQMQNLLGGGGDCRNALRALLVHRRVLPLNSPPGSRCNDQ